MKARTAYVHIGVPKTGTTSLQAFLEANRAALLDRGVLFPAATGSPNSIALVRCALDDARLAAPKSRVPLGGVADPVRFRRKFNDRLAAELAAARPRDLVFSSEQCASRLQGAEPAALRAFLAPFAEDIRIVCYLRRQDEIAISYYSTEVRQGRATAFAFPQPDAAGRRYDFLALLTLWGDAFGPDKLIVRRYGPDYFQGGRLVADFLGVMDLSGDGLEAPASVNRALSLPALEALRAFNASGNRDPGERDRLIASIETWPGPVLGASSRARRSFVDRFEAGNREVARRFLGTDGPLFDHPYPDDGAPGVE